MEKYSRLISVSGRTFRTSETMGDIFLAHVSDITERLVTELVPLLHEGGVDMLLIGPTSQIIVAEIPDTVPVDLSGADITGAHITGSHSMGTAA
jgi:hypothetical protein